MIVPPLSDLVSVTSAHGAGLVLGKPVAAGLNNLAELYVAQGRYAEAEPLNNRSLAIWEKALGPEHPNVATSLENYAALLRETGRTAEADKMAARAKAIRARHASVLIDKLIRLCLYLFSGGAIDGESGGDDLFER